jgi:hypothetical protein
MQLFLFDGLDCLWIGYLADATADDGIPELADCGTCNFRPCFIVS